MSAGPSRQKRRRRIAAFSSAQCACRTFGDVESRPRSPRPCPKAPESPDAGRSAHRHGEESRANPLGASSPIPSPEQAVTNVARQHVFDRRRVWRMVAPTPPRQVAAGLSPCVSAEARRTPWCGLQRIARNQQREYRAVRHWRRRPRTAPQSGPATTMPPIAVPNPSRDIEADSFSATRGREAFSARHFLLADLGTVPPGRRPNNASRCRRETSREKQVPLRQDP